MDTGNLILITELMLIAVAVAVAVKYVRLPYTVALVLVGLAVGFSDLFPSLHLSKEVILFVFLPPLLFEGTLNMDLKMLRDRSAVVGVLALFGTLITTILMGLLLHWLLKLPLPIAMLLGAIITPTDPVSVLATFKEYGVTKGLSTIVEGESVFNDGIGVVLYTILTLAGAPPLLFYGAVGGLMAWPHHAIPLFFGAMLSRYYFARKFGEKKWKAYAPILLAGYACGFSLIGMTSISIVLIAKSISQVVF